MTPPVHRPGVHTSLGDHEKRIRALERQRISPGSVNSIVLPYATAWAADQDPQTVTGNGELRFTNTDTNDPDGDVFEFHFAGSPDPQPDEIVFNLPGVYLCWGAVTWPDIDGISALTLLEPFQQIPVSYGFNHLDAFVSGSLVGDDQLSRALTTLTVHPTGGSVTLGVSFASDPPGSIPDLDIERRALTVVRLNDYVSEFQAPEGEGGGGDCVGGYCCDTSGNGLFYWDASSGSGTPSCESNPGGSWLVVATHPDGTWSQVGVGGERNGEGITCGPNGDWVDPGC
jgi:hypothetical protein